MRLQLISVNDVLRNMIIDADSDGFAESLMFDTTNDGIPDTKVILKQPEYMYDCV